MGSMKMRERGKRDFQNMRGKGKSERQNEKRGELYERRSCRSEKGHGLKSPVLSQVPFCFGF